MKQGCSNTVDGWHGLIAHVNRGEVVGYPACVWFAHFTTSLKSNCNALQTLHSVSSVKLTRPFSILDNWHKETPETLAKSRSDKFRLCRLLRTSRPMRVNNC